MSLRKVFGKKIESILQWLWLNVKTLQNILEHSQTPLISKAICFFAVAYALSPIDLIPDFIPILGYLDELIILPALVVLAVRFTPADIVYQCRLKASESMSAAEKNTPSYFGLMIILFIWLLLMIGCLEIIKIYL